MPAPVSAQSHEPSSHLRRLRWPLALFAGAILAFQIGWLIGVPPYGQMDEIDHAYKAASVAQGHWGSSTATSPLARGNLLSVPAPMVAAAHNFCHSLKYQEPGNCSPLTKPDRNGDVLVGSAAAPYDPIYYAIVGTPAIHLAPHSGTAMDIIMRVITAVWCDLLIGAAVLITASIARSIWPTVAVMVTAMPVLLCASAAAAPNGVQMAGGLLMWAALCRLVLDTSGQRTSLVLGLWSAGSCCVLISHSSGPLWFALSSLLALYLLGRQRVIGLVTTHRSALLASLTPVIAAGLFSVYWTLSNGTNISGNIVSTTTASGQHVSPPLSNYFQQPFSWWLQLIGAVPFRNDFGPPFTYIFGFVLIVGLLTVAWRWASPRTRWALLLIVVATFAIPEVLTYLTYANAPNSWQGRYSLALTYGAPLLAGWAINARFARKEPDRTKELVWCVTTGIVAAVINAVILVNQWNAWSHRQWLRFNGGSPANVLVWALGIVGALLMVAAFERLARRGSDLAVAGFKSTPSLMS